MKNREVQQSIRDGNDRHVVFESIISLNNLFFAWDEFVKGKSRKVDVMEFSRNLEDNLFLLHSKLKLGKCQHGSYQSFFVFDPKKRHIHKASVADRVLHHAIVRVIEPIFDPCFIFDSYSCRDNKGVHAALERFSKFGWRLSHNNTKTVWALKCDIKSFFDSVNHEILISLLSDRIQDQKALNLLKEVIYSFNKELGRGLPLGNLTSQLFANIYLNPLDQFIKNELRAKYYTRYCDDFVILDRDKEILVQYIHRIDEFIRSKLKLEFHARKIILGKYHKGVDFLGFICFPHFRILRTKTKRRMFRKLEEGFNKDAFISYLGLVKHARSRGVKMQMIQKIV